MSPSDYGPCPWRGKFTTGRAFGVVRDLSYGSCPWEPRIFIYGPGPWRIASTTGPAHGIIDAHV